MTTSPKGMQKSWTSTEIGELSKALAIVCVGQNAYGTEQQFSQRFDFWVMKLERKYTVNQILHALDIYTDKNSDIPTPSDIIKLLSPEPTRISNAEFIHAKEQWKLEGYPSYSYYAGIVKEYEKQQGDSRNIEPIADIPLNKLIGDITKKLEIKND